MGEARKPYFHYVTVFAFSCTVLLMSMRAGNKMSYVVLKKGIETDVLSSSIGLHRDNLLIKKALNQGLELEETPRNFRFVFKEINPYDLLKSSMNLT